MEPTSSQEATGRSHQSARRRLIRGAFSAPAALTLYSGSSFAAASNGACLARRTSNPVNPGEVGSATSDVYMRVQVRAKGTGSGASRWVSGTDLLNVPLSFTPVPSPAIPTSKSFLSSNNWYCLAAGDTSGNTSGYLPGQIYSDAAAIAGGTPALVPNAFVALRVDSTGMVVGVTDTAGASALSRSCWTSFARTI